MRIKKLHLWILSIVLMVVFGMFVAVSVEAQVNCITEAECDTVGAAQGVNVRWVASSECAGISGGGKCIVTTDAITLGVPIPGQGSSVDSIAQYINFIFRFLLGAAGVVAATMLVWGGYTYLTAAGNQARISQGKEIILGALVGLALLLGSTLGLEFINERLVTQNIIEVELIIPNNAEIDVGFCNPGESLAGSDCGEVVTVGNKTCRSLGDTGGNCTGATPVCLPFIISEINDASGYKCYAWDELDDACENAPSGSCDLVSEKMEVSTSPVYTKRCGGLNIGCGVGDPLELCKNYVGQINVYSGNRAPCSTCGGEEFYDDNTYPFDDDRYRCQDGDNAIGWHVDGFLEDEWGAICCQHIGGTDVWLTSENPDGQCWIDDPSNDTCDDGYSG